jgi:2-polyprenyl-6-methoxyphenol hydroxylase-like FAD-dependent oxidoreductase
MSPPRHVIIVGAGLAGPALASSLAGQGIRSTILERHPAPRNIGGVILVAPNAMRVLDKLVGVESRLRSVGCSYDVINIYTEGSGNGLTRAGGFWTTNGGIQGLTIARPALQDILLDKCKEYEGRKVTIRYNSKLVKIDEKKDSVVAELEDGTRIEG